MAGIVKVISMLLRPENALGNKVDQIPSSETPCCILTRRDLTLEDSITHVVFPLDFTVLALRRQP